MGIQKVSVKDVSKNSALVDFIRHLIVLVKAANLPFLERLSLSDFGVLNPVKILELARSMEMNEADNWFSIFINTDCAKACKISLRDLPFAIPLLKPNDLKVSRQVEISFYVGPHIDFVSSAFLEDLSRGKLNLNYLHDVIRPSLAHYFSAQTKSSREQEHIPAPIYGTIDGLEVDGKYAVFPLKGKFQSIYVLPKINSNCSYRSPLILKLRGSTLLSLANGNVMVSDQVGGECGR